MTTQTFTRTKGDKFRAFRIFVMQDYIAYETRWGRTSSAAVAYLSDSVRFTNYATKSVFCENMAEAQTALDKWRRRMIKDGYNGEKTWRE